MSGRQMATFLRLAWGAHESSGGLLFNPAGMQWLPKTASDVYRFAAAAHPQPVIGAPNPSHFLNICIWSLACVWVERHEVGARRVEPDPVMDDPPSAGDGSSADNSGAEEEKAAILEGSDDMGVGLVENSAATVVVAWRDPAASLQESLLNPELVDRWRSWADVQRHVWFSNIPAAFFRHQIAWVFQKQRPRLHLVYPSLLLLAADGAPSGSAPRREGCSGSVWRGAGRVFWIHDVVCDEFRAFGDGAAPPWTASADTFEYWKAVADEFRVTQQQPLYPWGAATVWSWPTQIDWRQDPQGGVVDLRLPLEQLDGARLIRARLLDGESVLGVNEAFYVRSGCVTLPAADWEGQEVLVVQLLWRRRLHPRAGAAPARLGRVCTAAASGGALPAASAHWPGPVAGARPGTRRESGGSGDSGTD